MPKISKIIILIFLVVFILNGLQNMITTPLHDFDEANRAESAKNMKKYQSFLIPLNGAPFERIENLKIQAKNNPYLYLYYHLERPPLFYWLMILSTSIFGENEFAYRLPSFIFGIVLILIFFLFFNPISSLAIILSFDLWLSLQQALMDTTLTFFLFLAFLFLIKFLENKKQKYLIFSSIFWSLAFLTKGQSTFIFVFPFIFLLLTKKIKFKDLILFCLFSFLIIFPWFFLLIKKFDLITFSSIFFSFAKNRALSLDTTQQAPFFWYFRWLFESARPVWILFLTFIIYDIVEKRLNFKKIFTLFYFFCGFFLFSFSKNKVWWYILPLLPIMTYYLYLSTKDLLRQNNKIINLSLIIFITSLPIFYHQRNIIALILITVYVLISFLIIKLNISFKTKLLKNLIFPFSVIFSLIIFLFNFPPIQPTYPEIKRVGEYYKKLPQPKCLYVEDMPYESALFYTNAEEINYLNANTKLNLKCNNYLLTPNDKNDQLIFKINRLKLYEFLITK